MNPSLKMSVAGAAALESFAVVPWQSSSCPIALPCSPMEYLLAIPLACGRGCLLPGRLWFLLSALAFSGKKK